MRKVLAIFITIIMILSISLLSGCWTYSIPSNLSVKVSQEPVGGNNINSLTCTYTVTYTHSGTFVDGKWTYNGRDSESPPDPVTLKVVWVNDKGGRYNEEELVFGILEGNKKSGTYTTKWQTPSPGQVFDKTFWVRFSWEDADGKHEQDSNKAVCNVR